MKNVFFIILFILLSKVSIGQSLGIGQWNSYFSFNTAKAVAAGSDRIFSGKYGLLIFNTKYNDITTFTKVNGLSDVNINKMAYNQALDALVIVYDNSNIDIYQNGIFYNLPDIKNANVIASKKINNIHFFGNDAYLSTGLGIVIINVIKHEIKATYPMLYGGNQADVTDLAMQNNTLFATTSLGIFKADTNNAFLQNIDNWTLQNNNSFSKIIATSDSLYLCKDSILYSWDGANNTRKIFNGGLPITDIAYANNTIFLGLFNGYGKIVSLQKDGTIILNKSGFSPNQLTIDATNKLWIANSYGGLCDFNNTGYANYISGTGPATIDAFNMRFLDNSLYLCSGSVNSNYVFQYNRNGVNKYSNNSWFNYSQYNNLFPQMDTIFDILDVAVNTNTKDLYLASFGAGLIKIDKNNNLTQYAKNSFIHPNGNNNLWYATALKMDVNNVLWISITNADNSFVALKPDGTYQSFYVPLSTSGDLKVFNQIEIDNANQKWICLANRGLLVYNDNNTLDNITDDQYKIYTSNPGSGNLASNNVNCTAVDKDGKIWVGTDNGISIINCPESAISTGGCDAENKIVQYDNLAAGKLFQDQYITTIAVDGANRKWVGTPEGAWLLSADAEKIITQFNINNSPLPSNEINKIDIDPVSGLVYFATNNGVVSYKGTATDGAIENTDLLVYPNPIASNYTGTIAIKGLATNADVRIIDEAGQMVYRTTALGGQAIWNGKTYSGAKPQSGVYYVLATNADGSITQKTKFIFMH